MGLFQPNYNKPGRGVDETAPRKRSFFRFWELFGRKLGKLVKINVIYALAIIPTFVLGLFLAGLITSPILSNDSVRESIYIVATQLSDTMKVPAVELSEKICLLLDAVGRVVISYLFASLWGMGPATAGATVVWRNFSREEHAWLWSDFKDTLKNNIKQATAVFLIDVILFVVFCFAINVYASAPGMIGALQYIIWIIAIIYTMMHFYLYPMMITFDLSLKDLYRNALIFAIGKLPSNIFVLVCILAVHLIPAYFLAVLAGDYFILFLAGMVLLESVVLLSFSGFLVNFNASYKMEKYMINQQETMEE